MIERQEEQLLQRIYGAATGADEWPAVVKDLGTMFRSIATVFVQNTADPGVSIMIAPDLSERDVARYRSHYGRVNPVVHAAMGKPDLTPLPAFALVSEAEFVRSEYYNDWYEPLGLFDGVGAGFQTGPDTRMMAGLMRPRASGAFTAEELRAFERILPHLKRAMSIAQRLSARTALATGALQALERLRLTSILLTRRGTVVQAEGAALEALAEQGIQIEDGLLWLGTAEASLAFRRRVARAADSAMGENFALPRLGANRRPIRGHLVPAPATLATFGAGGAAVLLLIEAEAPQVTSMDWFAKAHGLTAAETRLVAALAEGETVTAYCKRHTISHNTAKTQLAAIFQKTGVHRQADLVRLVHAAAHASAI